MRTISSIRTAALVAALAVTACSQRAEPRPPPSQDPTTMTAFAPAAVLLVIALQAGFDEAARGSRNPLRGAAGADLEARQS